MIFDPIEEKLFEKTVNRYQLVAAISKRVAQLNKGMPPLIENSSARNATIAIRELAEGKIKFRIEKE